MSHCSSSDVRASARDSSRDLGAQQLPSLGFFMLRAALLPPGNAKRMGRGLRGRPLVELAAGEAGTGGMLMDTSSATSGAGSRPSHRSKQEPGRPFSRNP